MPESCGVGRPRRSCQQGDFFCPALPGTLSVYSCYSGLIINSPYNLFTFKGSNLDNKNSHPMKSILHLNFPETLG